MVCECLVELLHVFLEKTFTYLVPKELEDKIKVGMRVEVPFGKRNLEGFVMSISNDRRDDIDLKNIIRLVDDYPVLNKELLELGKYMRGVTLASLMSCYSAMLPKALKAKSSVNINKKFDKYVRLNKDVNLSLIKLNATQSIIISKFS